MAKKKEQAEVVETNARTERWFTIQSTWGKEKNKQIHSWHILQRAWLLCWGLGVWQDRWNLNQTWKVRTTEQKLSRLANY